MTHVHSLNSSGSKQKYSFGKGQRFAPYKPNTDVSYLPKSIPDRRSAIIGYGERALLYDKYHAVYPHSYSIPSTIETKKGNSLKAGRYEIGGPMENVYLNRNLPGPSYTLPSTLDQRGPTLKSRKPDTEIKIKKFIPGPGSYELPSSIDNGQTSVVESRFARGGSMKIPPKQYKSLVLRTPTYEKKSVPGPGQYDTQKYGIGNSENPLVQKSNIKIGKQIRPGVQNRQAAKVPGPGQYKIYSQFDD